MNGSGRAPSSDRTRMLLYVEGRLPDHEVAALNEALKGDVSLQREFAELLVQCVQLKKLGQQKELRNVSAPLKRVATRRFPARRETGPLRYGKVGLIAAVILLVIALLVTLLPSDTRRRGPAPDAGARARTNMESPTRSPVGEIPPERQDSALAPKLEGPRPVAPDAPPQEPPAGLPRPEDKPAPPPAAERRPADPPRVGQESPVRTPPQETLKPAADTKPALATVERAEGEVYVISDGRKFSTRAAEGILANQGVESVGEKSHAVITYADGTRLELRPDTTVRELLQKTEKEKAGKWIELSKGSLMIKVPRQPEGRPLVIATPQAEATVLGTTLRIVVDPEPASRTLLEVIEGRVRLTRKSDQKAVEVTAGHFTVAATGIELVAKPVPVDDIVLRPKDARMAGNEWQAVRDPEASSGWALEALTNARRTPQRLSDGPCAVFAFRADADRDYTVWVRGRTLGTTSERRGGSIFSGSDAVILEVPTGVVTEAGDGAHSTYAAPNRAFYDGFVVRPGYWWLGGDMNAAHQLNREEVPVRVRFQRAGLQALKLYAFEVPMRIDSIWLSAVQKTRPAENQRAPEPAHRK